MDYKKLSDFLWPIAATVLALIGMPLAIEQYPDFFKENRWPLPISLIAVVICWIIPFFLHERAKKLLEWVKSFGWVAKSLAGTVVIAILVLLTIGRSVKLFRFHTSHLASVLRKKEAKPEPLEQRHEEPKTESPRVESPPTSKRKLFESQWREKMAAALEGDLRGANEVVTTESGLMPHPVLEVGDSGSMLLLLASSNGPYLVPFSDAEFRLEYGRKVLW